MTPVSDSTVWPLHQRGYCIKLNQIRNETVLSREIAAAVKAGRTRISDGSGLFLLVGVKGTDRCSWRPKRPQQKRPSTRQNSAVNRVLRDAPSAPPQLAGICRLRVAGLRRLVTQAFDPGRFAAVEAQAQQAASATRTWATIADAVCGSWSGVHGESLRHAPVFSTMAGWIESDRAAAISSAMQSASST